MNTPATIVFDLDDTLAVSKQPLTSDMASHLAHLLEETKVAVISGAALPQFLTQVVAQLPPAAKFENLYLLPTGGAAFYTFDKGDWKEEYALQLSAEEAETIERVIREAAEETGLIDFKEQSWGERIEFRKAQVTLSALGQQAPVEAKRMWDPDHTKRLALQAIIAPRLPDFSVKIGGATSIDVTRKGIDKAYGVEKLAEFLGLPVTSMLYVGDALFPGGNDEVVKKSGIPTQQVANPAETALVIEKILSAS